jgi:hypothetical protein
MLRRAHLALSIAALACCFAGCAGARTDESDDPDVSEGALGDGWESVGLGVSYKKTGDGDAVFIAYGGYSVKDEWSRAWTTELHKQKLKALGVGHLYAVKGPNDAGYNAREIANSKLAAHLLAGRAAAAPFILVAAHSSGSYVAHELLADLYRTNAPLDTAGATRGKVVYANLDGGGAGLDQHIVGQLRRVAFVYAEDTKLGAGRSANAGAAESLGAAYGHTTLRIVDDHSGCHSGARWCLHDMLVTTRPHDPDRFDLARDYTDFAGRPVQVGWIDALASSLR